MTSNVLMKLWICAYMVTAIVSLYEKNYPRVLYYISASLITISVLWGMK